MNSPPNGRWLCIDPGETTGWSMWKGDKLLGGHQTPLWDVAHELYDELWIEEEGRYVETALFAKGDQLWLGPGVTDEDNDGPIELVVCERFALYPDKAKQMAWDEFRTVQLIGALTFICALFDVKLHKQPASIKERAMAGGAKELFVRPLHENRHQNDSIMHGFFYLQVECKGINLGIPDRGGVLEPSV